MNIAPDHRDAVVLKFLADAVVAGRRCPTNPEISIALDEQDVRVPGGVNGALKRLARAGHITVWVYGRNFRAAGPDRPGAGAGGPRPRALKRSSPRCSATSIVGRKRETGRMNRYDWLATAISGFFMLMSWRNARKAVKALQDTKAAIAAWWRDHEAGR